MVKLALDMRLKVALVTLGAICAAMVARPAHAAEPFPMKAAMAVCELSNEIPQERQLEFWRGATKQLDLDPEQEVQVRTFCLGYKLGQVAELNRLAAALRDNGQ